MDGSSDNFELTCPACGHGFTPEGGTGKRLSVPCPECGTKTPVAPELRDAMAPVSRRQWKQQADLEADNEQTTASEKPLPDIIAEANAPTDLRHNLELIPPPDPPNVPEESEVQVDDPVDIPADEGSPTDEMAAEEVPTDKLPAEELPDAADGPIDAPSEPRASTEELPAGPDPERMATEELPTESDEERTATEELPTESDASTDVDSTLQTPEEEDDLPGDDDPTNIQSAVDLPDPDEDELPGEDDPTNIQSAVDLPAGEEEAAPPGDDDPTNIEPAVQAPDDSDDAIKIRGRIKSEGDAASGADRRNTDLQWAVDTDQAGTSETDVDKFGKLPPSAGSASESDRRSETREGPDVVHKSRLPDVSIPTDAPEEPPESIALPTGSDLNDDPEAAEEPAGSDDAGSPDETTPPNEPAAGSRPLEASRRKPRHNRSTEPMQIGDEFEGTDSAVEPPAGGDSHTLRDVAIGLVTAAAILGLFALVATDRLPSFGADETTAEPNTSGQTAELAPAIAAASETLHRATAVDLDDLSLRRRVADQLADDDQPRRAARIYDSMWAQRRNRRDFAIRYLELLVASGRHGRARQVAIDSLQRFEQSEVFRQTYTESLGDDPLLGDGQTVELDDVEGLEVAGPADGYDVDGAMVAFTEDGERRRFLFEPATTDARNWRDSVAAWRLCRAIACGFEMPRTRPARISRSTWEGLEAEAANLRWTEADGADGERRDYLYGALKAWPGAVVGWPIERTDIWRPWLWVHNDGASLDESVADALAPLDEAGRSDLKDRLLEETGEATVRRMAAQLSGVLTFDFLTNNWGRFAEDEEAYGTANHFRDGRFVTLRTDTVFQGRTSTRVEGRFKWATRFSSDTITSLRLFSPELAREVIYPDPTAEQEAKLDIFLDQRRRVLEHVDELVAKHGRDAVLAFE